MTIKSSQISHKLELENNLLKQRIAELEIEGERLKQTNIRLIELVDEVTKFATDRIEQLGKDVKNEVIEPLKVVPSVFEAYNVINELNGRCIQAYATDLEKYSDAPKAKKKKADDFWEPWKTVYDEYLKKNKGPSWALRRVLEDIKVSGTWLNRTNKKSEVPDLSTARRQLANKKNDAYCIMPRKFMLHTRVCTSNPMPPYFANQNFAIAYACTLNNSKGEQQYAIRCINNIGRYRPLSINT